MVDITLKIGDQRLHVPELIGHFSAANVAMVSFAPLVVVSNETRAIRRPIVQTILQPVGALHIDPRKFPNDHLTDGAVRINHPGVIEEFRPGHTNKGITRV
ncbi:MAG: hypothetical protein HZA23_07255 [Nitrospirae bacterium]|nr:hypothetical protein [Nitrospirota bacterium]